MGYGDETITGELAQGVTERYLPGVPLFAAAVSTNLGILHEASHAEPWIIAMECPPTRAAVLDYAARWAIEQLHREGKQVTGLERCQCRKARIQCNHIGCAFLVWVKLKELAAQTGRTVYQLKHGLLDDYLIQQLKNSSLKMGFA